MHKVARKLLRAVAHVDPDYFDMYEDRAEALFARLYLERIRRHAAAAGIGQGASVLEAGCQAGRLAIPLAKDGFRVTGVDTSRFGLRRAAEHAKQAGVTATWIRGDILDALRRHPGPYDMVVCAEVLYLCENYRDILRALAGALRPGGLAFVSHRPKAYYLYEALKLNDLKTAERVLGSKEGQFRDSAYYNWQTGPELQALYQASGLAWQAAYPIDTVAWISGANLAGMSPEQQAQWLAVELSAPSGTEALSRYVLVVASRP